MDNSSELMLNVALLVKSILILAFYFGETGLEILNNSFLRQLLASATLVPISMQSRNPALVPTSASITYYVCNLCLIRKYLAHIYLYRVFVNYI